MTEFRIDAIVNPRRAVSGSRRVRVELDRTEMAAERMQSVISRAFAFGSIALGIRQLGGLADAFTNVQNRLRTVTKGQEDLTFVTGRLFDIANRTRSAFDATAEVFARVGLAASELGRTQSELLNFTESLNQAVALSGASATEAQAGLLQLSQGLASGALRGDELRSVLEQLPVVADVIAKSLGVTRGELRDLGQQGKISAEIVLDAFRDAREELEDRFGEAVPTLGQSFVVLRNNIVEYVGAVDQATGASASVSRTILALAQNVDILGKGVQTLAISLSVTLAKRAIPAAIAAIRALGLAVVANPIGAIAKALLLAGSAAFAFRKEIADLQVGGVRLGDVLGAVFDSISERVRFLGGRISDIAGAVLPPLIESVSKFAQAFSFALVLMGKDAIKFANGFSNVFLKAFGGEEGAIGVLKTFGNFAIATATTVGDVFDSVISTIFEGFKLLASFDPKNPIDSLARIVVQGFTKTSIEINDVLKDAQDNFGTDYVAGFAKIGELAGLNLKDAFLTEGFRGLSGLDAFKAFFSIGGDISANLAKRAGKRAGDAFRAGLAAALKAVTGGGGGSSALGGGGSGALIPATAIASVNDLGGAFGQVRSQADELSLSLSQGLKRGLEIGLDGITNVGGAAIDLLANGFARAEDAIVQFALTGKFEFTSFVNSIIADIARLLARQFAVELLFAFFGGAAGGGSGPLDADRVVAGIDAPITPGGLPITASGPFGPGGRSLGGGSDPQIFTPRSAGDTTSVARAGGESVAGGRVGERGGLGSAPSGQPINVTVVNVTDPNELLAVMAGREGDELIVNAISRNKGEVSQVLPQQR